MNVRRLLQRVRNRLVAPGRRDAERIWSTIHDRKKGWAEKYLASWDAPHRRFLVPLLKSDLHGPLLELGCGSAPNLVALTESMDPPFPRLHGIDINPEAVRVASAHASTKGWRHLTVVQGTLPEALRPEPDQAWDTTLAVALFQHLAPETFEESLRETARVTRRRIVVMDLHSFQPFFGGATRSPHRRFRDRWERNWWEARGHLPGWTLTVSELPSEFNRAREGDINALIVATRTPGPLPKA
jgi:SAM-dependent methyltransferase